MFRYLGCFVHFPERLTGAGHEHRACMGGVGTMAQGPVYFVWPVCELGEILEMRCLLWYFLPQGLNRIAIWRIGWQRFEGQGSGRRLANRLHRLARVLPGSILHDPDRRGRLRQDVEPKCRITRRVDAPGMGLVKESTGERVKATKDLVRFACTAAGDRGLLPLRRPRVAQGAPRSKPGLIAEESEGFALLSLA